ncbi:MAG: hypothetical protein ACOCXA_04785, partial [Planctomycetota bacterium]
MTIIEVADHIHASDRAGDLTLALRRATSRLADGDTLRLPAGRHDLRQDCCEQTMLMVTNHDPCIHSHGLLVRDRRDITIDGQGCTLDVHDLVVPIWLEGCHGVRMRDLHIDRPEPMDGQGEILSVDEERIELRLDPASNPAWFVHNGILTFQSRRWR